MIAPKPQSSDFGLEWNSDMLKALTSGIDFVK